MTRRISSMDSLLKVLSFVPLRISSLHSITQFRNTDPWWRVYYNSKTGNSSVLVGPSLNESEGDQTSCGSDSLSVDPHLNNITKTKGAFETLRDPYKMWIIIFLSCFNLLPQTKVFFLYSELPRTRVSRKYLLFFNYGRWLKDQEKKILILV